MKRELKQLNLSLDRAQSWGGLLVLALAIYAPLLTSCSTTTQDASVPQSTTSSTVQASDTGTAPVESMTSSLSPTDEGAENLSSSGERDTCPITPIQTDFWDRVGPVAGEYPVWMTSRGQTSLSSLGPRVLPPKSGEMAFDMGRMTKLLLFVDKEVQGDLLISGRQLDGEGKVYFPRAMDTERIDDTTLQLRDVPPDFLVLRMHISRRIFRNPRGNHIEAGERWSRVPAVMNSHSKSQYIGLRLHWKFLTSNGTH